MEEIWDVKENSPAAKNWELIDVLPDYTKAYVFNECVVISKEEYKNLKKNLLRGISEKKTSSLVHEHQAV